MAVALVFLLAILAGVSTARLGELSRRDSGDVFTITGDACGAAQCAEHGAGTHEPGACACACPQRAPLFREDRELCVDDLPECSLATFGTGAGVQRIPFVYLPLKGQIIHPSKEITFKDVKTPICAVSGAQFLTRKGFLDLRNTLDSDVPFNLFRDEGRTFLQWSGEDDVRARMTGRLMVVRLLCRDVSATPASPLDLRGVFTPCVAFRVQGSPLRHSSNITEVQFAPNAQTSEVINSSGLSVSEYVAIGISSLLLGLIYVASVFLFLHIRKRRKAASENGGINRLKGLKKKDGSIITEQDIIRINNERPLTKVLGQDDGVIKKNPLLSMARQFHEAKSFSCDSGSNISDSEDFAESSSRSEDNIYNSQVTSAVVHLHQGEHGSKHQSDGLEISHRDESTIERLPDEHVSIVETTDDREIARPVGTTRRKLYFNPAYFEPHLMAEPPPAALEFLVKIREVIAIAKHKMASKRFQPVLNQIPEEETYPSAGNSIDLYQGLGSQRSGSVISLKRENSRKKTANCVGCPGCQADNENDVHNFMKYNVPACTNCLHGKGDKQNSIRKWLENIPPTKTTENNEFLQNNNQKNIASFLMTLPIHERHRIRKQNSFSNTSPLHQRDITERHKRSSTMSVRSEPAMRNYNIPLPEFNMDDFEQPNYNKFSQTVSRVENFRSAHFNDYHSGSLRNNALANQRRNRYITNKNALPDMVNDTIALDECSKVYHQSSSDDERFNRNSGLNENRYTRRRSESPLCNDYETDSLERSTHQKRIGTPSDYPDVPSSQASPSLSNALPLEEELTMRNAIYKNSSSNSNTPSPQRDICIEQNHYETIEKVKTVKQNTNALKKQSSDYSLVSEVYVNNNYNFDSTPTSPSGSECSMGSRKLITNINNNVEGKPGCLTIEVVDPPENYIKIHESDGFEPDTLDRKNPKHKEIVETITAVQFTRKDLDDNLSRKHSLHNQAIQLRSSGTFTKSTEKVEYTPKFHSLRNEFEYRKNISDRPKISANTFDNSKPATESDDTLDVTEEWSTEEGRILTLELRHSKRQRQCTPPTIKQLKNLARPDILPPLPPTEDSPIYEQPTYPPRKVEIDNLLVETPSKNVNGRSLSPRKYTKNATIESPSNANCIELEYGPSCSPLRASGHLPSSEYQINPLNSSKMGNVSRNSSRRQSLRNSINTNTFVKGSAKEDQCKPRFRRRKGQCIEDSGYLSSDSTSSRQVSRKLVIHKIVSCSESDDTENEARSESGAESVETHSVYFGSFRKLQMDVKNDFVGERDSKTKLK
ncbi:uncharacterized protein sha [Plodia interpunctella]|uniref:uncharacterized protein sha n=1 Tax=Plodia interpunctella TaxID=58824 RepID=UPI002368167F|nr:uncharacterized protein LOC128677575 [Plodia interpunctella]XP_053614495.1 uncharacterized protein LOC128677575 [Plodia interpunctella]XP_053614496.1 uncharacterized protein LOC128677575 [Plodia interpunctella]